ncbi:MAG: TM2 domain-containing protein [Bacteroidales bacterium]|jgi:TM2 domain-containing membrane protein YozV|nr:TM2 domain-containing protein [Bacteroidales bacterium]
MKKKLFLGLLILFAGQMFAQPMENPIQGTEYEVSFEDTPHLALRTPHPTSNSVEIQQDSSLNQKDPVIAWLIAFPAGMLGLHRVYLGTDVKTVLLYIVTAGGFLGIVPMVDWILLLKGIQNGDISKYERNKRFIMWL